jgi:hypothetical protein
MASRSTTQKVSTTDCISMNKDELRELAGILLAIANGAEWECYWETDGWGHPVGRDIECCIANRIPIRIKK